MLAAAPSAPEGRISGSGANRRRLSASAPRLDLVSVSDIAPRLRERSCKRHCAGFDYYGR